MTTTPHLSRYRIKELIQFIRNALMIVSQHGLDSLRVKAQYRVLSKLYQQLERTYKQDKSDILAQKLVQLDAARDQAIVCLRMISEGYSRHPSEAEREAGQRVLDCIDKYGSRLYNLNHSAETAVLKKIVHDLQSSPACTEALERMHLAAIVNEIKRTNQEFERQFVRHLEAVSQENGPRVRELVQQTIGAYRTLVEHTAAHALLTPSAEYTLFGHHLNENVEHFNQVVERRQQARKASAEAANASAADAKEEVSP